MIKFQIVLAFQILFILFIYIDVYIANFIYTSATAFTLLPLKIAIRRVENPVYSVTKNIPFSEKNLISTKILFLNKKKYINSGFLIKFVRLILTVNAKSNLRKENLNLFKILMYKKIILKYYKVLRLLVFFNCMKRF